MSQDEFLYPNELTPHNMELWGSQFFLPPHTRGENIWKELGLNPGPRAPQTTLTAIP